MPSLRVVRLNVKTARSQGPGSSAWNDDKPRDEMDIVGRHAAPGLAPGAGKTEVKANLGSPPDEQSDTWTYDLPAHCVAAGSMTLESTHGRVSALRLGAYHELKADAPKSK